jgi:PEP-CTERM motif
MSAWFSLKWLGLAALALGISAVSLWPERATANIIFDFSGTCNIVGCPTATDTATGVLTLTDAYVFGTDITSATFVSFSYSSNLTFAPITSGDSPLVLGGFNSDGAFISAEGFEVEEGYGHTFLSAGGSFVAVGDMGANQNSGNMSTFTHVTAPPSPVPEPSTWAMLLIGFAGLGYASYRASRKSAAVAA